MTDAAVLVTGNAGDSIAAEPAVAGSFVNAAFGAELGVVVLVTHVMPVPDVWFCTQPEGRAGAVTPSNFSFSVVDSAPVEYV